MERKPPAIFDWRGEGLLGAALVSSPLGLLAQDAARPKVAPVFAAADPAWKRTGSAAIAVLAGNIRNVPGYQKPLLFEGSTYQGAWLECGPHEGLVYATVAKSIPSDATKGDATKVGPLKLRVTITWRSLSCSGRTVNCRRA